MATAHLDIQLDEKIRAKAEKASALLGLNNITEYIVRLMDEDATKVVAEYERMTLTNEEFDRFIEACDKAQEPNQALIDAVSMAQECNVPRYFN